MMKSPSLDTEFVSLLLAILAAGLAVVSQVGPSNGSSTAIVENIALALIGASARGLGTSQSQDSSPEPQQKIRKPRTPKNKEISSSEA